MSVALLFLVIVLGVQSAADIIAKVMEGRLGIVHHYLESAEEQLLIRAEKRYSFKNLKNMLVTMIKGDVSSVSLADIRRLLRSLKTELENLQKLGPLDRETVQYVIDAARMLCTIGNDLTSEWNSGRCSKSVIPRWVDNPMETLKKLIDGVNTLESIVFATYDQA